MKCILIKAASHGDWKTASVFPKRWPVLAAGTEVEVIKVWWNFYGDQVQVKAPGISGAYDLSLDHFNADDRQTLIMRFKEVEVSHR